MNIDKYNIYIKKYYLLKYYIFTGNINYMLNHLIKFLNIEIKVHIV